MLDSPTEAYPPVLPSEDEDGSSADEISGDDDDVIDDEIPTDNEDDIVDTSVKNLDDVPSGSLADGVAEGDDGISRDAINVDDNLAFDDVVPMHEVENEIGDELAQQMKSMLKRSRTTSNTRTTRTTARPWTIMTTWMMTRTRTGMTSTSKTIWSRTKFLL